MMHPERSAVSTRPNVTAGRSNDVLPALAIFEEVNGVVTAGRNNAPPRRTRPRGYAPWRPQAKNRALLEQVLAIFDEYDDYKPLTARQIFYRLVGHFGYEKDDKAVERLNTMLGRARRARVIPFRWMRDDGIVSYSPTWYSGEEGFWDSMGEKVDSYRRDRQAGQPQRIEVWCESAGMAPQLANVCNKFSIPVYTASGFTGLTGVRQIVNRARELSVSLHVLHLGDYDPSGESIYQSMIEDAQAFLEEDRILASQTIVGCRIALTQKQIDDYDVQTVPPKESDKRTKRWNEDGKGETAQLEALDPQTLAHLLDSEIRSRLRIGVYEEQLRLEEQDRLSIRALMPAAESTE